MNELALGGAPLAAPAAVDADVADRDPAAVSDLGEGDGRPEVAHLLGAVQQAEGRPDTGTGQTETGLGGDVTEDETDGDAEKFGQDSDSDSDSDDYDAKTEVGAVLGMFVSRPGIHELKTEKSPTGTYGSVDAAPQMQEFESSTTSSNTERDPNPTSPEMTTTKTSAKNGGGPRPHSEVVSELLAKKGSESEGNGGGQKEMAETYSGKPHSQVLNELLAKTKGTTTKKHSDVVKEFLLLKKHKTPQAKVPGTDSPIVKIDTKKPPNTDFHKHAEVVQKVKTKISNKLVEEDTIQEESTHHKLQAVQDKTHTKPQVEKKGDKDTGTVLVIPNSAVPHSQVVKQFLKGKNPEGDTSKQREPEKNKAPTKKGNKDKGTAVVIPNSAVPHSQVVKQFLKGKNPEGDTSKQREPEKNKAPTKKGNKDKGTAVVIPNSAVPHSTVVKQFLNGKNPEGDTSKQREPEENKAPTVTVPHSVVPHAQVVQQFLKQDKSGVKKSVKSPQNVQTAGQSIPHSQMVQRLIAQGIKTTEKKGAVPHSQMVKEVQKDLLVQNLLARDPENADLKQVLQDDDEKVLEKVSPYTSTSDDFGSDIKLSLKEKFSSTTKRPLPLLTIDPDEHRRKPLDEILANSRPHTHYQAIKYNAQKVDQQIQTLKDIVGAALNDDLDRNAQVDTERPTGKPRPVAPFSKKKTGNSKKKSAPRPTTTTASPTETVRPTGNTATAKPTKKPIRRKASSGGGGLVDKNNRKKINKYRQSIKEKSSSTTKRPKPQMTTTQTWVSVGRPIWPARTTATRLRTTTSTTTTTTTTTTEATTRIELEVSGGEDPGVLSRMAGMVDSFRNSLFSFFGNFLGG